VRRQYVGDDARVSGHVVYRAWSTEGLSADLQWNAASIWVGRTATWFTTAARREQYNVVVTFHSRQGGVERSRRQREEVQSYFEASAGARKLIDLPKDGSAGPPRPRAHRPVDLRPRHAARRRAHPTLQYLAQGACMALEDAVTWRGLAHHVRGEWPPLRQGLRAVPALAHRTHRTHRAVGARDGRIFHAKAWSGGAQRPVERPHAERFYDAMEWLYG